MDHDLQHATHERNFSETAASDILQHSVQVRLEVVLIAKRATDADENYKYRKMHTSIYQNNNDAQTEKIYLERGRL